jgi:uncharacterized damage-inducible protein DinB
MIRERNRFMRSYCKLICCTTLLTGCAAFGNAQTAAAGGANPLSSGQKAMYSMVMGPIVAAAESMPEDNYSFKPTPDVRSFGQLVGHIAAAQYMFCSTAAGTPEKKDVEHTKTTKADLVQALKDGQAYCDKVYSSMTDTGGTETVKFFGHDVAKLNLLSFNTAHSDEHYGNMVTYMRLKGLVPPTSQPQVKPVNSAKK